MPFEDVSQEVYDALVQSADGGFDGAPSHPAAQVGALAGDESLVFLEVHLERQGVDGIPSGPWVGRVVAFTPTRAILVDVWPEDTTAAAWRRADLVRLSLEGGNLAWAVAADGLLPPGATVLLSYARGDLMALPLNPTVQHRSRAAGEFLPSLLEDLAAV